MKSSRLSTAVRLVACAALVVAVSGRAFAEEAPAGDAPAVGKIGPGAPPATPPAAPKAAKPAKGAAKTVAKGIAISPTTPVASGVNVHEKVLEECAIQSHLPRAIAQRNSDVVLTDGGGAMRLELKIVDVHAPSGGVFSGPKWVTVEGRLFQGKTLKGNFVAKESSMAGAKACTMLNKVIEVMAGDIATWLHAPAKDSRLGGAH